MTRPGDRSDVGLAAAARNHPGRVESGPEAAKPHRCRSPRCALCVGVDCNATVSQSGLSRPPSLPMLEILCKLKPGMKLYQLAHACRLYQGEDDKTYRDMREYLGDDPNMGSPRRVLQFLNGWGCRISKERFGTLERHLEEWAARWIRQLPQASKDILSLEPDVIGLVGESFDQLLTPHFGDTCAAKTLHALRYRALPAWDAYIKQTWLDEGGLPGQTAGETYSNFLGRVAEELLELKQDVERLRFSLTDVPELVKHHKESYDISLVKLVDEYYWITITKGYKAPDRDELEQWLGWESGSAPATVDH